MTRLLLAAAIAVSGVVAGPSSATGTVKPEPICVCPYDGCWCTPGLPEIGKPEQVCVCPYDGCWCVPA
jgi:hypothetical protein